MKCIQCGTELTTEDNTTSCICQNCLSGVNIRYPYAQGLWQYCPKCAGQGSVWFPPNMPYNPTYPTSGEPFTCDVCNGEKIISTINGLPPSRQQL